MSDEVAGSLRMAHRYRELIETFCRERARDVIGDDMRIWQFADTVLSGDFPCRRGTQEHVVLDVVINHSGDNWAYPGDFPYWYFEDRQFPLGFWRRDDRPIPVELRNDSLYHRRGAISSPGGYDTYPENQHGDIATLKDYANDDDARLLYGQEVLVAYNVSGDRRQDCIVVDASLHRKGDAMTYLYGDLGSRTLDQADDGTLYVRLPLEPHQFVILA